jgi:hypothetical protein
MSKRGGRVGSDMKDLFKSFRKFALRTWKCVLFLL